MSEDELELALIFLYSHRMDFLANFLAEHGLKKTGSKDELFDRLREAIRSEIVDPAEVVALLDSIEGWGNQHIYLYKTPKQLTTIWSNENKIRDILRDNRAVGLFNRFKPLVLPEKLELTSIGWEPHHVRFTWIDKRAWQERIEDKDEVDETDDIHWKAYKNRVARGVLAFDWNLVSGEAMLMIQQLPSGNNYEGAKSELFGVLSNFLDVESFEEMRISSAIKSLENSSEVRNRSIVHETALGNKARFTSKNRKRDAFRDRSIRASRNALGDNTRGFMGNFYWVADGKDLITEVHSVLYAEGQRIGFFGQHSEGQIRHVISRIQHHSK